MKDHVIVMVVEIFDKRSRIEVIDHRGNNKSFPFFEKLVLNEDLFDLASLITEQNPEAFKEQSSLEAEQDLLSRIELNELHLSILKAYVRTLLGSAAKRPKDFFEEVFGQPPDLEQIKSTTALDERLELQKIGVSSIQTVNGMISQIHQKIIELSLLDGQALSTYEPISAKAGKLNLNAAQYRLCKLYLQHQLNRRDKRVNDLFKNIYGADTNLQAVLSTDQIQSGEEKFQIGRGTVRASNILLEEVQNKAIVISEMDEKEVRTATLYYSFKSSECLMDDLPDEEDFLVLYADRNFLQLLCWFLQSPIFFKPNEVAVLAGFFLSDEEITLDELGRKLNLTRERVRQIKWKLFDKLPLLIKQYFFPYYEEECRSMLFPSSESDVLVLTGDYLRELNERHEVVLSSLAYTRIFKSLLENYELIGLDPISTSPKPNLNVQNRYLNFYLVNIRFFSFIQFQPLMDLVYNKLAYSRLDETVAADDFIAPFLLRKKPDKRSIYIIQKILQEEFNIQFENGKVIIPGTRQSSLLQLESILREAGRPMNLNEIYAEVQRQGIGLAKSTVHAYLIDNKDKFSLVGMSTFAHVSQNIKGGMISDLIEEYLIKEGKPMKVDDIYEEVQKHRKVRKRSHLLANCANLPKRFIVKGSVIGLRNRDTIQALEKANPEYTSREEKWEQNYRSVVSFLKTKRRVPSPTRSTGERFLYNFISFNKKSLHRLSEERKKKIADLLKLYPSAVFMQDDDAEELDSW